ncbi:hypothetical protein SAMN05877753_103237 [Bacillus oleivorans]|uniref:Uncharacterized protein n=1 Tax=Bacillus oleivorans TaxID=1448271 RepID=A0A285CS63_9BACI|nr:hypothetical protein [Bacillus oleivorans]SNX69803.1 hypothetical protein SAMN05877753_103237 [Bacillus oleivorans]
MESPEEQLERFIISSKEIIGNEGVKEIEHFFNHREYEMAFEGLLIELTTIGKYPKVFNFSDWKMLGERYHLDKEAVFAVDIWEKFIEWGKSY